LAIRHMRLAASDLRRLIRQQQHQHVHGWLACKCQDSAQLLRAWPVPNETAAMHEC
jgi:hypothetical protein